MRLWLQARGAPPVLAPLLGNLAWATQDTYKVFRNRLAGGFPYTRVEERSREPSGSPVARRPRMRPSMLMAYLIPSSSGMTLSLQ